MFMHQWRGRKAWREGVKHNFLQQASNSSKANRRVVQPEEEEGGERRAFCLFFPVHTTTHAETTHNKRFQM